MTKPFILEVIACTVADAVEAVRGGAHRLEIVSHLETGGLTPSPELVRQIKAQVAVPLRVMLRESVGFTAAGAAEVEKLCTAAREFAEIGVDGVVLGFLRADEVDLELTAGILSCAPNLKATFHHAFEATRDQRSAIEKLKTLRQIDRILSHGGAEPWAEKYRRLEDYAARARPQIEILAGGGIDPPAIELLREKTSLREFHAGKAARTGGAVEAAKVARLIRATLK